MIIALAGHVDHGKTSLVRALTGVETDRLPAEVERGLTIDLGFAYHQQGERRLGFVDVPGHHRFVHNMLAGIAPAQTALLVVAADDGVMPQTREHLMILNLLGIERGVIALTKCDIADATQQDNARAAIESLTKGTFLEAVNPIAVAAPAGTGIDALRAAIEAIPEAATSPDDERLRLPIDRAFSRKGAGTIVTGTLRSGRLAVDQLVHLFPDGREARVRSLHVDGEAAAIALPGSRCAVNLAGTDLDAVTRGGWLADRAEPGFQRLVLDYQQLADRPLKHWSRVHLYHGTSHTLAQAALLEERGALAAGSQTLLQLELDTPLLARCGDRLVVRDHAREQTLGGGRIVDLQPITGRRRAAQRLSRLRLQAEHTTPAAALSTELTAGTASLAQLANAWGLTDQAAQALATASDALSFGDSLLTRHHFDTLVQASGKQFAEASAGQSTPVAATQFLPEATPGVTDAILKHLLESKALERSGNGFVAPNQAVELTADEARLLETLTRHLKETPPPTLGDIAKRVRQALPDWQRTLKSLAGKRQLVLLENNRALLPEQFREYGALAALLGEFSVKDFRDASGLGRNLVVDILEAMDNRGFTRRNDNLRKVVATADKLG